MLKISIARYFLTSKFHFLTSRIEAKRVIHNLTQNFINLQGMHSNERLILPKAIFPLKYRGKEGSKVRSIRNVARCVLSLVRVACKEEEEEVEEEEWEKTSGGWRSIAKLLVST